MYSKTTTLSSFYDSITVVRNMSENRQTDWSLFSQVKRDINYYCNFFDATQWSICFYRGIKKKISKTNCRKSEMLRIWTILLLKMMNRLSKRIIGYQINWLLIQCCISTINKPAVTRISWAEVIRDSNMKQWQLWKHQCHTPNFVLNFMTRYKNDTLLQT